MRRRIELSKGELPPSSEGYSFRLNGRADEGKSHDAPVIPSTTVTVGVRHDK